MATPIKWGSEFLVNSTTFGYQDGSLIAALDNGCFVVVWSDYSPFGPADVRAQLFNADGSRSGDEFLVNTTTDGLQYASAIATLSDGRFVVTWRTDSSASQDDPSGSATRAQIFNADGSKSGSEFLVNTTTAADQYQSSVTALSDGRFVVAWTDKSASPDDPSGSAVRGQIFNSDGSKWGVEFLINTTTAVDQSQPSINALADGRFLVTWTDYSASLSNPSIYPWVHVADIRGQIFNSDGSKSGEEFTVNTSNTSWPINQSDSSIVGLKDGGFVVIWEKNYQDFRYTYPVVLAQVFDAEGRKVGDEFRVHTTWEDQQFGSCVTALPDGRFVVAWSLDNIDAYGPDEGTLGDPSGSAIRAQVFNPDGSKSGDEFLVNTTTEGSQYVRSIEALADGRFVVTWSNYAPHGDEEDYNLDVYSQIFDPREAAIALHGTVANDDYVGTIFDDRMWGNSGDDRLTGDGGNDDLVGEGGSDKLIGNQGDDELRGGDGNDVLRGGAGNDTLVGGHGHDRFVFAPGYGTDRIVDFDGRLDTLDLSAFGFQDMNAVKALAEQVGSDVIFNFATGDVLVVENTHLDQITSIRTTAASFRWGDEFLVNATTEGYQGASSITALDNGRFVVTWSDSSSSAGIRAQIFHADGSKAGSEFSVKTDDDGPVYGSSITTLTDGRLVVAWTDYSYGEGDPDPYDQAVYAQILNPDGSIWGSEFLVNTFTFGEQWNPSVSALSDGRFVITWDGYGDSGRRPVSGQIFNPDGSKSGGEFLVNVATPDWQYDPAITTLSDGRFLVTWTSEGGYSRKDFTHEDVRGQIFNSDGSKSGDEFQVSATSNWSQLELSTTALANGGFVVTWTHYYDPDERYSDPADRYSEVRAQVFAADGHKSGNEFVVYTTTVGDPYRSATAALPDGRFVVAWTVTGNYDPLSYVLPLDATIRAQIFNPDGSRSGNEFLADATTEGDQYLDSIEALADGRFVVTWMNDSPHGPEENYILDVFSQIFDPREAAIQLHGTKASDDFYGTRFNDGMWGSLGDDRLCGEGGNDKLIGNQGDDELRGGDGNDVLRGGAGNDTLVGGDGSDRFVFAPGHGTDRIAGFEVRTDKIDLSAFGIHNFAEARALAAEVGDDVVFTFATGDTLTLDSIALHQLAAVDLIL